MRLSFVSAILGVTMLAASAAGQELRLTPGAVPSALTPLVQPGSSVESLRTRSQMMVRNLDANGDGRLDAADVAMHDAVLAAAMRAAAASQIMNADLDGDGFVTEAEINAKLGYDRRSLEGRAREHVETRRAAELRRFSAADADKDGRVSWAEASAAVPDSRARRSPGALHIQELLSSVGRDAGALTADEVASLAEALVRSADSDGNGTISQEEFAAFQRQGAEHRRRTAAAQEARRVAEARPTCDLPKPSDAAEVVVLSAYESGALSTATIGFQDVETGAGTIHVEPGRAPLYLVVTTFRPVIWRVTGAVERVERVVLAATITGPNRSEPRAVPLAGAVGLPAGKVTFVTRPNCLRHFSEVPSGQAAMTIAAVRRETGKEPVVVASRYTVSDIGLPSGRIRQGRSEETVAIIREMAAPSGEAAAANAAAVAAAMRDFDRFYPAGLVRIDPAETVSSLPAARYEVLPSQAGLVQLLLRGALTRSAGGEYLIREKIRFPSGLFGAHSVRFLLLRDVPKPEGDPGHSCVISEESGESLNGIRPRC